LPAQIQVSFLGGTTFRYSAEEARRKQVRVLARNRGPSNREPIMLTFHYDSGRVFLSGAHPELEESEHLTYRLWYGEDPESDWPLLDRVMSFFSGNTEDQSFGPVGSDIDAGLP
jgi:hypothetical protein